jgi:hypothetical protein
MNALRTATIILLPTLAIAAVVMTGSAKPLQAAAGSMPTARAAGVMVNTSVDDEEENGMPALAFQGTFSQTKLALVVDSPEGGIIGFSRETSEATSFEDSTGKTLLEEDSHFGPFAFGERIVQDGKRLVLTLESKEGPSAKATSITATGSIDVTIAHEKKTYTSETNQVAEGQRLQAGPVQMSIEGYGKASWGDDMELTVQTKANVDAIVRYTAILPNGMRTELRRNSTMTFNDTTKLTLASEIDLGKTIALEIELWHNPKQRQVPFSVQANVGLK